MYPNQRIKGVFGLASIAGEWGNPSTVMNGLVRSKVTLPIRKFLLTCKHTVYGAPSYVGVSL